MNIWVARDDDGRLYIHFSEPVADLISGVHWQSFPYTSMINIDATPLAEQFKSLSPSDTPVKIKIKI